MKALQDLVHEDLVLVLGSSDVEHEVPNEFVYDYDIVKHCDLC